MYLRKNRVRCGKTHRTYYSIAHNVWWAREENKRAQSRPVVIASFGSEEKVDPEIARELVVAVERAAPPIAAGRGKSREATLRIASEVRRIEPFLKLLASRAFRLSETLPSGPERMAILEALVRAKLAEPDAPADQETILRSIQGTVFA